MSHGVAVEQAPAGFEVLAHTEGAPVAAMADESRKLYGAGTPQSSTPAWPEAYRKLPAPLRRAQRLGCLLDYRGSSQEDREKVGDAEAICGLSGGVDSAVAAALVHKAIGDQLTCVFVDHGLLRKGEVEQVGTTSSPRPASASSPSTPPTTSSTPSQASRAGAQAQIVGEKFIRTFEKASASPRRAGARGKEVKFSCRARSTCGRRRIRRRRRCGQHQEPLQRRRPARGHQVPAHRTAAHSVQG